MLRSFTRLASNLANRHLTRTMASVEKRGALFAGSQILFPRAAAVSYQAAGFATVSATEIEGVDKTIAAINKAIKDHDADQIILLSRQNTLEEAAIVKAEAMRKRALQEEQEKKEFDEADSEERRQKISAEAKKSRRNFEILSEILTEVYDRESCDLAIDVLLKAPPQEAKEMLSQFGPAKKARLFVHAMFNHKKKDHAEGVERFSELLSSVLESSSSVEKKRTLDFIKIAADFYRLPKIEDVSADMVVMAIKSSSVKALQLLIDAGVDCDYLDARSGKPPILLAAKFGNEKILAALLASGVNSEILTDANDNLLLSAILGGIRNAKSLKALAKTTLSPDAFCETGYAAIHLLQANKGAIDIIGALIERGADIDIEASAMSGDPGSNVLHIIAKRHYKSSDRELIEFLVDNEADLRKLNYDSYTPFQQAVIYGNYQVADDLLSCGVGVDEVNPNTGLSCLAFFTMAGDEKAVDYLLSRGANPEVKALKNIGFRNGLFLSEGDTVEDIAKLFKRTESSLHFLQAKLGLVPSHAVQPRGEVKRVERSRDGRSLAGDIGDEE